MDAEQSGETGPEKDLNRSEEPLRDYEHLKFELAALLREAIAALPTPHDSQMEREYRSIQSRLAEDQFNLAVVGPYNRGKTSLMNAVMGLDRLPTGIVPLTSVITSVRYGSREGAIVEFEHGGLPSQISLEQLPAYVTQDGNPGNEKGIRTVEVQLPAEVLRRGFRFVDTPGLGSAIAANTATTERYLPEADAIVFVSSCDAGLGQLEIEYLRSAQRLVRKVFLVINKLDLLSPQQVDQVRDFIQNRVSAEGLGDFPLFMLSARQGLQAKLEASAEMLRISGLPEFEHALVEFLVQEKSRELLVRNCDRLLQVLVSTGADGKLKSDVMALRRRFLGQEAEAHPDQPTQEINAAGIRLACPVCHAAGAQVWDFLSKFQYHISHDREVQRRHAETGGFCPLHTWQYESIASPSGASGGYHPVLLQMSSYLRKAAEDGDLEGAATRLQPSPAHCPACQTQRDAEEATVQKIVQMNTTFNGVVCLRHLILVLRHLPSEKARDLALRCAAAFDRLADDMQRFVLRQDGLQRTLISEEERRAYRVALELLAGIKRLAAPPQPETYL